MGWNIKNKENEKKRKRRRRRGKRRRKKERKKKECALDVLFLLPLAPECFLKSADPDSGLHGVCHGERAALDEGRGAGRALDVCPTLPKVTALCCGHSTKREVTARGGQGEQGIECFQFHFAILACYSDHG